MKKDEIILDMYELRKGNIWGIKDSEEFERFIRAYNRRLQELLSKIEDTECKKILEEIDNLKDELIIESQKSSYAYGFRFGFMLCLDILDD